MRLRCLQPQRSAGTHFGGSLYAMTDPFFALMLQANLGGEYLVWDKAGSIDYIAPAREPRVGAARTRRGRPRAASCA